MEKSIFIYLLLALVGLFLWKKNNNPQYLWSLLPVGILILLSIYQLFSEKYLTLGSSARMTEDWALIVLRSLALISFLYIGIKKWKRN
jgi:hypothetical protein